MTADGKANAIVALDPRTLKLKDWFTQPTAEFVTGPTVFRHGAKDVVAAATKDGRVILLDAASLGGANHATPLMASQSLVCERWLNRGGGAVDLGACGRRTPTARGPEERWILVPHPAGVGCSRDQRAIRSGAVVALRVTEAKGVFSLEPEWTSHDLTTPATPIIVNGVVFALSTGRPAAAGGTGSPAVLYAYDGVSGKALWNSGKSMTTFASPGSYWSALSQVYVGTDDGTVHAFGFARRASVISYFCWATLTWPYGHGHNREMKTMAAGEFKDKCLKTLDDVARNRTPIVITKRGRPVATLVPVAPAKRTVGLAGSVALRGRAIPSAPAKRGMAIVLDTHAWIWWVTSDAACRGRAATRHRRRQAKEVLCALARCRSGKSRRRSRKASSCSTGQSRTGLTARPFSPDCRWSS